MRSGEPVLTIHRIGNQDFFIRDIDDWSYILAGGKVKGRAFHVEGLTEWFSLHVDLARRYEELLFSFRTFDLTIRILGRACFCEHRLDYNQCTWNVSRVTNVAGKALREILWFRTFTSGRKIRLLPCEQQKRIRCYRVPNVVLN